MNAPPFFIKCCAPLSARRRRSGEVSALPRGEGEGVAELALAEAVENIGEIIDEGGGEGFGWHASCLGEPVEGRGRNNRIAPRSSEASAGAPPTHSNVTLPSERPSNTGNIRAAMDSWTMRPTSSAAPSDAAAGKERMMRHGCLPK